MLTLGAAGGLARGQRTRSTFGPTMRVVEGTWKGGSVTGEYLSPMRNGMH